MRRSVLTRTRRAAMSMSSSRSWAVETSSPSSFDHASSPIDATKAEFEVVRENEIRKAEVAVATPPATDAGLVFIGRIHTPWTSRMETPRQGRADGPLCHIEVFEPWVAALDSLAQFER